jgi:hypothetical protein
MARKTLDEAATRVLQPPFARQSYSLSLDAPRDGNGRTLNAEQIDSIISAAPGRARRADWVKVWRARPGMPTWPPHSGVKRTWSNEGVRSQFDPKRTISAASFWFSVEMRPVPNYDVSCERIVASQGGNYEHPLHSGIIDARRRRGWCACDSRPSRAS